MIRKIFLLSHSKDLALKTLWSSFTTSPTSMATDQNGTIRICSKSIQNISQNHLAGHIWSYLVILLAKHSVGPCAKPWFGAGGQLWRRKLGSSIWTSCHAQLAGDDDGDTMDSGGSVSTSNNKSIGKLVDWPNEQQPIGSGWPSVFTCACSSPILAIWYSQFFVNILEPPKHFDTTIHLVTDWLVKPVKRGQAHAMVCYIRTYDSSIWIHLVYTVLIGFDRF